MKHISDSTYNGREIVLMHDDSGYAIDIRRDDTDGEFIYGLTGIASQHEAIVTAHAFIDGYELAKRNEKPRRLALRLYKCTVCGGETMHTTNHEGSIYPGCGRCGVQTEQTYLEEVRVITIDTSKRLIDYVGAKDFRAIASALGRIIPGDNGRRVYITSRGSQAESNKQMKARLSK